MQPIIPFTNIFKVLLSKMRLKTIALFAIFCGMCAVGNRVKRHLVFNKGSRLFFSIDVRDNLFDYSNFFAHVFGFKMDWDLPHSLVEKPSKGRIQRRDVYQGIDVFLEQLQINGRSCIRKFSCEAAVLLPKFNHFLAQLYEIIFKPTDEEVIQVYNIPRNETGCRELLGRKNELNCPFSLVSLSLGNQMDFRLKE